MMKKYIIFALFLLATNMLIAQKGNGMLEFKIAPLKLIGRGFGGGIEAGFGRRFSVEGDVTRSIEFFTEEYRTISRLSSRYYIIIGKMNHAGFYTALQYTHTNGQLAVPSPPYQAKFLSPLSASATKSSLGLVLGCKILTKKNFTFDMNLGSASIIKTSRKLINNETDVLTSFRIGYRFG